RTWVTTFCAVAALLACATYKAPPAQSVSFIEPVDGAVVSSPFKVKFAVAGMEVRPSGDVVANAGHHHLLINLDSVKDGERIPVDEQHVHFGKGQTEAEIALPPGKYKLTMQFANGMHQ